MRALETRRKRDLLAATALALAATSIRQIGLVLPVAFGVVVLWREGWRRDALLRSLAPTAAVALAYAAWLVWLEHAGAAPDTYFMKYAELAASLADGGIVGRALSRLGYVTLMLGLFVAPLLLLRFGAVRRTLAQEARTNHRVFITVLLVLSVFLLGKRRDLPPLSGILFDLGVLPVLLHDIWTLRLPHWPRAPLVAWPAAMALAAGAASLVVTLVVQGAREALRRRHEGRSEPTDGTFAYGLALLALSTLPLLPLHMFDRYLLLPLILVLCVLSAMLARAPRAQAEPAGAAALDRVMRAAGAVLLGGFAAFSVAATHDFFAMSRARWAAIEGLMAAGVPAGRIAGGFEFANWQWLEHRVQPAAEPEYVIALGPVPGFREQSMVPFERWLSDERGAILVLAREAGPP